ncbi:MAG TPA: hypothetical protein VKA90_01800, partial [Beijerinckiaceae bacterium]|nr:hypothetical protein [Beijerinckiaceae bacterium]
RAGERGLGIAAVLMIRIAVEPIQQSVGALDDDEQFSAESRGTPYSAPLSACRVGHLRGLPYADRTPVRAPAPIVLQLSSKLYAALGDNRNGPGLVFKAARNRFSITGDACAVRREPVR